jgi:hypothetical protein
MKQKGYSFKKLICTEEKERVWFANKTDGTTIEVYNQSKNEFLGNIERLRVGKFMHWVFCPEPDMFFTNGCLKEISKFITKLYSK